jgi:DNA repair protein RadA/Sms
METPPLKQSNKNSRFTALNAASSVVKLQDVELDTIHRTSTGFSELDRVLGGGLAAESVVLLGGDPGIGKSTLLLQTLANLTGKVLYVSGEESVSQIAMRYQRLDLGLSDNIYLLSEICIDKILQHAQKENPKIIVIDSIQTLYSTILQSTPGSVAQVRECANMLTRFAKEHKKIVLMVGHVTKDGAIAGPKVLEHIVDAVLYFEGDQHSNFRMLRSIKNRFGAVNELGVFSMTDKGLREVNNPSAIFLSSYNTSNAGSSIFVSQEGTRPMLVEVQALVTKSYITPPKRLSVGMDSYRLSLILAILQKYVKLFDYDVFINIVGGLKINEPALDIAVLLAILSSYHNQALPPMIATFGELGLAGEIRAVQKGQDRIKEAAKLGFKTIIVPYNNKPKSVIDGIEVIPVKHIKELFSVVDIIP